MVHKIKQRLVAPNLVTDGGTPSTSLVPVPAAGAVMTPLNMSLRRMRFKITDMLASVTAANDFGSVKLCDLPNTNLLFIGCVVDLTAAVTGTGSSLAAVDLAVGTVATASAAFSNAGEKNLCGKIDCTAGGVIDGNSVAAETNINIAAGASNAVYLNVATGNITTDGGVTLNGYVDLLYYDIGKAA